MKNDDYLKIIEHTNTPFTSLERAAKGIEQAINETTSMRNWATSYSHDHFSKVFRDQEKLIIKFNQIENWNRYIAEASENSKKLATAFEEINKYEKVQIALRRKLSEESSKPHGKIQATDHKPEVGLRKDTVKIVVHASSTRQSKPAQKIVSAPGSWMGSIAGFLYSKKTREHVFEPIIADFQNEFFEELSKGASPARLLNVRSRHWFGFIASVALQAIASVAKVVREFKSAS